jgi:hypothetical protein
MRSPCWRRVKRSSKLHLFSLGCSCMEKLFLQVTAQDYGQRVKETRKATVQKNKRKVVVDLELLGKLPPLRSYMCPLFFEAVPDFGWTLAPSRPTFRPSELQRARDSEPLHIKVGWPPFHALQYCTCGLWSRQWRYLQNWIFEWHHCLSCQPPLSLLLLIGTYLVEVDRDISPKHRVMLRMLQDIQLPCLWVPHSVPSHRALRSMSYLKV